MVKQVKVNEDSIKTIKRPSPYETDSDWQDYFEAMRKYVLPRRKKRITNKDVFLHNSLFYDIPKTENGELLWQRYCSFVNDILLSIRHGKIDYCFYIYQIAELLQYEHNRLRTAWMPEQECFKVWLAQEGV